MQTLLATGSAPDPLTALIVGTLLLGGLALLFWPHGGLLGRRRRLRQLSARTAREHALKQIATAEIDGLVARTVTVADALEISVGEADELIVDLERRGLLQRAGSEVRLTPAGREYARHIIRTHRLWERYLADTTGLSATEWHREADRLEHILSPGDVTRLSERLGNPSHDPHGDPIPTETGEVIHSRGQPLAEAPLDRPFRISHIEDEPETVYAQIVAESLSPGMLVKVLESDPRRIRFVADGEEHVLAPAIAKNISLLPVPESQAREVPGSRRLSGLRPGESARVLGVSAACRGPERRRLLDLGFVPGTTVEVAFISPSGDPTAYRVRGTLIGLRKEQAAWIQVAAMDMDEVSL